MGLPPSAGAVHDIVADATPAVATTLMGAEGSVPGVTALDRTEGWLGPTALVATTENV
jgi:hypothetical protein